MGFMFWWFCGIRWMGLGVDADTAALPQAFDLPARRDYSFASVGTGAPAPRRLTPRRIGQTKR